MSVYPSSFKSIEHVKNYFAFVVLMFLSACGGGGNNTPSSTVASSSQPVISSSSSSAQSSLAAKKGTFIDSQVSGLEYQTASRTGITDANGGFEYDQDGEFVSFSIGGKFIGTARANSTVHVFDLEGKGQFTDTTQGQRVAQLLQTLDQDKNSSNGIQLSDATRTILQAQQSIDFTASETDWNNRLNTLATAASKAVVPLQTAISHATSTQTASGCIVPDATYPSVDEANLGKFSTAGRTCDRKARAMAFYEYVDMEMRLAENEIRSSREIAEGEKIAQADVERLVSNNIVNNSLAVIMDHIAFTDVQSKDGAANVALKVLSNTAKLTEDLTVLFAGISCSSNNTCANPQDVSLKMTVVVLDEISTSSACLAKKLDKCAEFIKSSGKIRALLIELYGGEPDDKLAKFAPVVAAWAGVAVDTADAYNDKNLSSLMNAAASWTDSIIKTSTNYYTRSSDETAYRTGTANTFEIMGEAFKVATSCATFKSLDPEEIFKQKAKCAQDLFSYYNQRAAEIAAYIFLDLTATELQNRAEDLAVARLMLSEIHHYDGTNGMLAHYGIATPASEADVIAGLRKVMPIVAAKAGLEAARSNYVVLGGVAATNSVLNLMLQYGTLTKSKAAAILAGKLTSCQSVELGELNSLQFLRDPNYSYLISAPANKTLDFSATYSPSASVVGYEFNFGDGTILASDIPAASHLYNATGFYYATVAPVVKQVNGSVVSCRSKQKAVGFRVDDLKPRISSVQPLTAPLGVATAFTVKGRNLPLTSVMSIADATCQTPANRSALGFTVQCTLGGLVGDKVVTIKTDALANGGTEIKQTNMVTATQVVQPSVGIWMGWDGKNFTIADVLQKTGYITKATANWGVLRTRLSDVVNGDNFRLELRIKNDPALGGINYRDMGIRLDNQFGTGLFNTDGTEKLTREITFLTRNGWSNDFFLVGSSSGSSGYLYQNGVVSNSDWHTYTMTVKNNIVTLHYDGVLKYSQPFTGTIGTLDSLSVWGLMNVELDVSSIKFSTP